MKEQKIKNNDENISKESNIKTNDSFVEDQNKENQLESNSTHDATKQSKKKKKAKRTGQEKIKHLLNKKDIWYKGIFTYRSLRIIGFFLLIFAQVYVLYSGVSSFIEMPKWTGKLTQVLQILSLFSLPMFLAANLCVIMANKNRIKKNLILYSVMAILFYLAIIFVYYRYVYGMIAAITQDPATAFELSEMLAKGIFAKIINYNVFIDLALFSMFYFFLFYTPKKIKTKKRLLFFRWCSIIPILFAVLSAILYMLNYLEVVNLPVAVLALMPCRSLAIYAIFVVISLIIKLRKRKFIKYGATEEEYEKYLTTKRNSFEVSVIASVVTCIICVLDFTILIIYPPFILSGIGTSFYMIVIVPFILLLSYNKQPKLKILDALLPVIFIIIVILLYLETGLIVIKNL